MNLSTIVIVVFTIILTVAFAKRKDLDESIESRILKECNLMRSSTTPGITDASQLPIRVETFISLERVVRIDDLTESFKFTGGIVVEFHISCLNEVSKKYNSSLISNRIWVVTNPEEYWKPPLVNTNSMEDYGLQNSIMRVVGVVPYEGTYSYTHSGFFTVSCPLDFRKFPFDTQTCEAIFSLWLGTRYVNLTKAYEVFINGQGGFFSENSGWTLKRAWVNLKVLDFSPIDYYQITFTVIIKRRSEYFISAIIVPCVILTIVQPISFLIPPELPDRSNFAITILLSFTVLQATVQGNTPKTPQTILINFLVTAEMTAALLITIYAGITNALWNSYHARAEQEVEFCRIKMHYCRAVDFVACAIFVVGLIILNITVFVLIFE